VAQACEEEGGLIPGESIPFLRRISGTFDNPRDCALQRLLQRRIAAPSRLAAVPRHRHAGRRDVHARCASTSVSGPTARNPERLRRDTTREGRLAGFIRLCGLRRRRMQ
jgi:hypothetical protein